MVKDKFIKKSVGTLTLGEKLKKIRSEKRISLGEASRETKIQIKYLEDLENDFYDNLPPDVYVKGFLRSYAEYLGVNENLLVRLYEREREIKRNLNRKEGKQSFIQPIKFTNFIITPKLILFVFILVFIFSGFFYLYREANLFISTPRLVINNSGENITTNEKTFNLSGISDRDAEVTINGQNILVNEEGKFSEKVTLQEGLNTITVVARNRFNKETIRTIQITSGSSMTSTGENIQDNLMASENIEQIGQEKITLELSVQGSPTWISIEADGNLVFSGIINPEEGKIFEGQNKVSISSAKGNQTFIKINGQDKGPLSNEPGLVKNIVFISENNK